MAACWACSEATWQLFSRLLPKLQPSLWYVFLCQQLSKHGGAVIIDTPLRSNENCQNLKQSTSRLMVLLSSIYTAGLSPPAWPSWCFLQVYDKIQEKMISGLAQDPGKANTRLSTAQHAFAGGLAGAAASMVRLRLPCRFSKRGLVFVPCAGEGPSEALKLSCFGKLPHQFKAFEVDH